MPTFDFTSPDGKQYSVDGPGGATPEQAFAILQRHFPGFVLDKKPAGMFDDIPSSSKFDAEAARKAGYTDAEIRGVHGALQAGYSPQEISDHLSKSRGMFDDIQPVGGKLGNAQSNGPWNDFQQQPDGPWKDFGSWRGDPVTSPPPGFQLDQQPPQGILGHAADFVKSIPGGLINAASEFARGDQIEAENRARAFTDQPNAGPEVPTGKAAAKLVGLPTPQGPAGEYGASVGDFLGNPASYLGPGRALLKGGLAVLGGLGAQAGEDTGLPGGRLAGAVLSSVAGAKALGPKTVKAAVPTEAELRAAKDAGYAEARNSGVELDPQKFASDFAVPAAHHLTQSEKYAFTGGKDGTAPRTLGLLERLQNPPDDAIVTASGLDTLQKQINDIAGETRDFKPTADAKAAMVLKRLYSDYLESVPEDHVLAGRAPDYALAVGKANADNAAFRKVQNFNQKIANAEEKSAGTSGPSLSNTLGTEARQFLRNPKAQRGYAPEEVAAVKGINRGTLTSNVLNQLGRGGAGVVPMMIQLASAIPAAAATGGASIIPQAILAGSLYGARKLGERMTAKQAQALVDLLAKRSPLYQQRLNALPPPQPSAVPAAALRAIAASQ